MKTLIKNAQIVNENQIFKGDLLIENDLILKLEMIFLKKMHIGLLTLTENIFYLVSSMIRCISESPV